MTVNYLMYRKIFKKMPLKLLLLVSGLLATINGVIAESFIRKPSFRIWTSLSPRRRGIRNLLNRLSPLLIVFCSVASVNVVEAESELLSFDRTWIREAPPGVPTLAAYMDITNNTESPITITAVSSKASKRAELHEVKMDNDVMQMRKMDEVIIQPGQTFQLKAGGSHVMLMGVESSYKEGDEIEIEFELKDHPAVKVMVPVKKE